MLKKYFNKINISTNLILIFFIFLVTLAIFVTHKKIDGTNPLVKYLTMYSMVEKSTFAIPDSFSDIADDKIFKDGKFYSSKPPLLSITGAGIYFLLHNLFGFNIIENNYFIYPNYSIYFITIFLVGTSYIFLIFYLYKTLQLLKINKAKHLPLLIGLSLGTLYLSYLPTFNNHTIAGSLIFIAFYYLLEIKIKKSLNIKNKLLLIGLLTSLAAFIDIPTGGTFLLLFAVYIFYTSSKKQIIYYLLPLIPIAFIHFYFQFQITGDFLPPQFHPEMWTYTEHQKHMGTFFSETSILNYIFNILFGTHGLFIYTPILLFSFYSIFKIFKNKKHEFQNEAIMILVGFLIIISFYIFKARAYGGSAFGFRWLIAITPMLYFFNILLFKKERSNRFNSIYEILLIASCAIAFIGLFNPWPFPYFKIISPFGNETEYGLLFPLLVNFTDILNITKDFLGI